LCIDKIELKKLGAAGMDVARNVNLIRGFLIERQKIILMNRTDYNSFLKKRNFKFRGENSR